MAPEYVSGAVALQASCFPPPFDPSLHWKPRHLLAHIERYPEGQFVVLSEAGEVVASCSNCLVSEGTWQHHGSWIQTVGGPSIEGHDPFGSTLYGLDIAVHPSWRGTGIGRTLYETRFSLVRSSGLARYGTGCRLPDFSAAKSRQPELDVATYAREVSEGIRRDRTLSPLLRFGMTYLGVLNNYMQDDESADAAALLEWKP